MDNDLMGIGKHWCIKPDKKVLNSFKSITQKKLNP